MTAYNFGDVIFVDFPFADIKASKRRPAVVISSSAYHVHKQDMLALAITSQLFPIAALGETEIMDWKEAGLPKPSVLKSNIATVVSGRIIRQLGSLSGRDTQSLRRLLNHIIG